MELQKKVTGDVDTAVILETLDMEPDELSVGEHMDISEECDGDEQDEDVPGK